MRKSIFTAMLALAGFIASAQSVEDAVKQLEGKKNDKAKEIIDKVTADPNLKNAHAWLVKAQVYNALAVDEKFKATVPDAYEQAFEAYKKAYELEPNNKMIVLDYYKTPFVAYEGVANKAASAYQANNIALAFETYRKALEYGAYLNSKNLSFNSYTVPKLDTGMIFMAGYTAMKLEKVDDAITYFSRLANAKVGREPDYIIPYQFLSFQYKTKKDEANFKKYVELGRTVYPNDPYFVTINLDWAREQKKYPELFKTYEELIAIQPDTMNNYLSYASEMFDYLFKSSETRPADFDTIAGKIESNLKKTLGKNYETHSSNILMTQLYYNQGVEFATEMDKIRSTKPDDVKKKNELKAKAIAKYELAIPYAQKLAADLETKGMSNLKLSEKATLKNMYIMLGEMYTLKGDKVKATEYDKKYTAMKQ